MLPKETVAQYDVGGVHYLRNGQCLACVYPIRDARA